MFFKQHYQLIERVVEQLGPVVVVKVHEVFLDVVKAVFQEVSYVVPENIEAYFGFSRFCKEAVSFWYVSKNTPSLLSHNLDNISKTIV